MQKLLVISVSFILLVASQTGSATEQARTTTNEYQLRVLLDASSVTCDGRCPEAIGNFITWAPWTEKTIHTDRCTAFLAAADVVGTDSHCIPPEVIANPALCAERIGIKFPAVGNRPAETLTCTEFIQTSYLPNRDWKNDGEVPNLKDPDFAFFRVQRSARVPLAISRKGVKNHAALTFYVARKIPPAPNQIYHLDAIIKAQFCPTAQRSVFIQYLHDFSNWAMSEGDACSIEHGDSGAPAVDETGVVPTILVATTEVKKGLEEYAAQQDILLQTAKAWPTPAYSQNYACLDLPREVNQQAKPSECSRLAELDAQAMDARTVSSNKFEKAEQARDLKAFEEQRPSIFWTKSHADVSNRDTDYHFDLKCLIPKESWPKNAPAINNNIVSAKFYEQATSYKMSINARMFLATKKVKNEIRQNEIGINLSLVGAVDSVVGTRSVNGVKSSFSTHWCSTTEYNNN